MCAHGQQIEKAGCFRTLVLEIYPDRQTRFHAHRSESKCVLCFAQCAVFVAKRTKHLRQRIPRFGMLRAFVDRGRKCIARFIRTMQQQQHGSHIVPRVRVVWLKGDELAQQRERGQRVAMAHIPAREVQSRACERRLEIGRAHESLACSGRFAKIGERDSEIVVRERVFGICS